MRVSGSGVRAKRVRTSQAAAARRPSHAQEVHRRTSLTAPCVHFTSPTLTGCLHFSRALVYVAAHGILDPMRAISRHGNGRFTSRVLVLLRSRRDDDVVKLPVVEQGPVHCAACNIAMEGRSSADVRRDSVARRVGLPPTGVGARANPSRCRGGHMQGGSYVSPARTFGRRAGRVAGVHATAREERAGQAAVRRALSHWDSAFAAAEKRPVLRGAPAPRPRPLPRGGISLLQPRSAPECRRREVRGRRCGKAPSAPWFCDVPAPDPRGWTGADSEREEAGQAAGFVSRFRGGSLTADTVAPEVDRPGRDPHAPRRASYPDPPPHQHPSSTWSRTCIRLLSLHFFSASIAFLSRHRSFTSHTLRPRVRQPSCVTK